jgi:hypothetical protein
MWHDKGPSLLKGYGYDSVSAEQSRNYRFVVCWKRKDDKAANKKTTNWVAN